MYTQAICYWMYHLSVVDLTGSNMFMELPTYARKKWSLTSLQPYPRLVSLPNLSLESPEACIARRYETIDPAQHPELQQGNWQSVRKMSQQPQLCREVLGLTRESFS